MKVPIAIIIGAIIVSLTIHYSLRFNLEDEFIKMCAKSQYNALDTMDGNIRKAKAECY